MSDPAETALGARVRAADAERFVAARLAPADIQMRLFALYAVNLEVAAAPWRVSEPHLGVIRLKWLSERLVGARDAAPTASAGEAVDALGALVHALKPPAEALSRWVEARGHDLEADIGGASEAEIAAFARSVEDGAGQLCRLASFFCLERETDEGRAAAEAAGYALGLARAFEATSAYAAAGRVLLPVAPTERQALLSGETPPGVRATARRLARAALDRLDATRRHAIDRAALPALLAAWPAEAALRRVASEDALDLHAAPPLRAPAALAFGALWRFWLGRW